MRQHFTSFCLMSDWKDIVERINNPEQRRQVLFDDGALLRESGIDLNSVVLDDGDMLIGANVHFADPRTLTKIFEAAKVPFNIGTTEIVSIFSDVSTSGLPFLSAGTRLAFHPTFVGDYDDVDVIVNCGAPDNPPPLRDGVMIILINMAVCPITRLLKWTAAALPSIFGLVPAILTQKGLWWNAGNEVDTLLNIYQKAESDFRPMDIPGNQEEFFDLLGARAPKGKEDVDLPWVVVFGDAAESSVPSADDRVQLTEDEKTATLENRAVEAIGFYANISDDDIKKLVAVMSWIVASLSPMSATLWDWSKNGFNLDSITLNNIVALENGFSDAPGNPDRHLGTLVHDAAYGPSWKKTAVVSNERTAGSTVTISEEWFTALAAATAHDGQTLALNMLSVFDKTNVDARCSTLAAAFFAALEPFFTNRTDDMIAHEAFSITACSPTRVIGADPEVTKTTPVGVVFINQLEEGAKQLLPAFHGEIELLAENLRKVATQRMIRLKFSSIDVDANNLRALPTLARPAVFSMNGKGDKNIFDLKNGLMIQGRKIFDGDEIPKNKTLGFIITGQVLRSL